jgi:hypothetical protein
MIDCRLGSVLETNICSAYAPFTATQRLAEG